jgi:hypothetical protein
MEADRYDKQKQDKSDYCIYICEGFHPYLHDRLTN